MASTKDNAGQRADQDSVQTDSGEPIAADAVVGETPLQREQREITQRDDVDEDGIHTGITGPPKHANDSVDDGADPERPNITPLGRDVKYPHQVPGMQGSTTHDVTVEDVEKDRDEDAARTKRVDVNADKGSARTAATDTPGNKR